MEGQELRQGGSIARYAGTRRAWFAVLGTAVGGAALAACGQGTASPSGAPTTAAGTAGGSPQAGTVNYATLSGTVRIDGSSTVFPVSEAMAEEFQGATGGKVRVTVGISGTGGGFQKFCAGETDISDASRPILTAEQGRCAEAGIKWVEAPVAFDGLSVVVSPRNTFVTSMTVSELKMMWQPEAQGTITRWNQIRPEWPDRPFRLYGAGSDSGTFDYWTDAINGKEKASRGDYTASEDDNVLVQGVSSDPDALGYFGYAYYVENKDRLKLVAIDGEKGEGPVLPSPETIQNGKYVPLSRPIFVYPKLEALNRPEVLGFMQFYLDPRNSQLINDTGYVAFPEDAYRQIWDRVQNKRTGSVFSGTSTLGVTLQDLLKSPPPLT
ncbi:MAG TPA: PstS family phosphate ABC transporter substrate-binding protein [Chloroflexota bacterium]|jgi:phosphate transport system substrate-binding protein|nr:PstS family phosphate ABC transporter substrate-binding protein [Chloroflexota bacterium]